MIEHTDSQGRTWHALEREGGSISIYYTRASSAAHYVVFDSLEGLAAHEDLRRENERLRARLAEGEEIVAEAVVIRDRHKSEIADLRDALEGLLNASETYRTAEDRWDGAVVEEMTAEAFKALGDALEDAGATVIIRENTARTALATDRRAETAALLERTGM